MSNFSQKVNQNLIDTLEFLHANPPPAGVVPLSLLGEKDKVWDGHRSDTQEVQEIYSKNTDFAKYASRLSECSTYLDFGIDKEKGLKLKRSFFCKVRNCPVCQWRKSLYWKAMMYQTYDKLKQDYKKYRWIFLTLTVQNPHITDLRGTLKLMHNAWRKLEKRKEMSGVFGWLRATEVTRCKQNPYTHAHPHYHILIMVEPDYFKNPKKYVSFDTLVRLWQDCLGVSYMPNIDVRAVKAGGRGNGAKSERDIVAEILKYACKPSDMIYDKTPQSAFWFYEYTKQVHKMRFIASGGLLKNALKDERDISNSDMIALGDDDKEQSDDKRLLSFTYYNEKRQYLYNPKNNT